MSLLGSIKVKILERTIPPPVIAAGDISISPEAKWIPLLPDNEDLRIYASCVIEAPTPIATVDFETPDLSLHQVPVIKPVWRKGYIGSIEIMSGYIIDRDTDIRVSGRFEGIRHGECKRPAREIKHPSVHRTLPDIRCSFISTACKGRPATVREGKEYVYSTTLILKPEHPRSLDKSELVYFWRELVRKSPHKSGADLELLAIFRNIEVDRFISIKYRTKENELTLVPKPTKDQQRVNVRCYDIIYGVQHETGKILKAILESG